MSFEVVVVGGGIGGLTCAALLAARGARVCLLERASRAGGCAASFEHLGHEFETGAGLYAGWEPSGLHERVFAELPVAKPEAREVSPAYTVRLPGGEDVRVGVGLEEFCETLGAAFPECAGAAVNFYRDASQIADALRRAARQTPALACASKLQLMRLAASEPRLAPRILKARGDTAARHLKGTSARFRRFVDAQLQTFALCPSDTCSYLYAAVALAEPLRAAHELRGGAQAFADALVEAVTKSGGTVRLDTTALRLSFDAQGRANGVTLLTGETVGATRAVVSNLTAWDTFGKLVGAERTPAHVRARLKNLRGQGVYQIFMSLDEEAARRLPSDRVLASQDDSAFMLGAAPAWDARAPEGKRAATVTAFTDAEQWFTFHADEAGHEGQDARSLEALWSRLHAALPELGSGAEVFETATPRTFYERTRRRFGMVCGLPRTPELTGGAGALTHRTSVPNLLMVGDTVFPGAGLAAVTHSALIVAGELAPRTVRA
ncbi:MAG: FAD-dependent oxidoreductase [Acidobacteria bacterium]|nr:FAD-dependent oxidoreductase [Acidobacteriota bacterium]